MAKAYYMPVVPSSHTFTAQKQRNAQLCPSINGYGKSNKKCGHLPTASGAQCTFHPIEEGCTPLSYFAYDCWWKFFQELNPLWLSPIANNISTKIVQNSYNNFINDMIDMIDMIKWSLGGFMGIDGAINRLSKSESNEIVHLLLLFI